MKIGATVIMCALALMGGMAVRAAEVPDKPEILPKTKLFDPLMADPRWPHFSATVQDYGGDNGLDTVGAVSLGDGFSLYQAPGLGGAWGVGFQAAVFALFDLDSESKDLINADYWVGIPLEWRSGEWSAIARLYHQSSHLGDEYLLRSSENQRSRVNLSYEVVDFKLSRDLFDRAFRIYGGAGYLFDQEPADIKHGLAQWGAEMRGPWTFAADRLRPIAAVDFQTAEEGGWDVDISARAGLELLSTSARDFTVQMTVDYYHGHNPNGQFFNDVVDYYGIGLHAYY